MILIHLFTTCSFIFARRANAAIKLTLLVDSFFRHLQAQFRMVAYPASVNPPNSVGGRLVIFRCLRHLLYYFTRKNLPHKNVGDFYVRFLEY